MSVQGVASRIPAHTLQPGPTLRECRQDEPVDASTRPDVLDPSLVGTYPVKAKAGGGYVWDAVLEYRVWCHSDDGADHFRAFASFEEAERFAKATPGAEEPLALVLQEEYIDESPPGEYEHVRERRVTEWPVEFLSRPRRTPRAIPDFMASDSPDRLDILRGLS
jgi:hypothetical protein